MIVVVGSGIAGVAAAAKLVKAGKKVLVLQANGYPGGRLLTNRIPVSSGGEFAFDLGASWIHGSGDQNPLTALCDKIGMKRVVTDDQSLITFDLEGNQRQKQSNAAFEEYQNMMRKTQKYVGEDTSLQFFMKERDEQLLLNPYFMHTVSNDIQFQTSADIDELGVAIGTSDDEFQGKQQLVLSGYQTLVQALIKMRNVEVRLNSKVVAVTKKGDSSVVHVQGGKTFEAQKVIIAVPLGVLKKNYIQFNPALSEQKVDVIDRIGFGNVCKILIDFKEKLWQTDKHYISVVQSDVTKRGLCTYFMNLAPLANKPMLMTFGLGNNADQAQLMSEQDIKDLIASRLTAFCSRPIQPSDFFIARTSWRTQQNFRGTYTYPTVGFTYKDWEKLAEPVFQHGWYFAGEHISFRYRGTVHGACITGQVAADDILKKKTKENWVFMDKVWWDENKEQDQQGAGSSSNSVKSQSSGKSQNKEQEQNEVQQGENQQGEGQTGQIAQQIGQAD